MSVGLGLSLIAGVLTSAVVSAAQATSQPAPTTVEPARFISGDLTQLSAPHATAVDSRGLIYAGNEGRPVTVHAPTAGNFAPVATLDAPVNEWGSPYGISVDEQDRVWVAYDQCRIARYPDLGASPAALVLPDRVWQVPLLADGGGSGCRGVVLTADGSSFWASNANYGTLGRFSATGPSGGVLVPDRILSGLASNPQFFPVGSPNYNCCEYLGPWGLTLDPDGNVVVVSQGNRVLAVNPDAGFVPQNEDTRDDWSTWNPEWTAWQITGLQYAMAAVRRPDGSTVVIADGSDGTHVPRAPFLFVLPPGTSDAMQTPPLLSLTPSADLQFRSPAGFSVSANGETAFVPTKFYNEIAAFSLTDGSVSWPPWTPPEPSTPAPSTPESSVSTPAGPSPLPSTSTVVEASPSSPAADTAPVSTSSGDPASTVSPTRAIAPGITLVSGESVQRVRTEFSSVVSAAPVVKATTGRAIAPIITGFPPGATVKATVRRGGKVVPVGTITAGADGTVRLPGMRLSRPGRLLIMLTDETGAKRYVAIQVRGVR